MNCPNCNQGLINFPAIIKDKKQSVWAHPDNPMINCDKKDGLKITIEVIDEYIVDKFQEYVKNNQKTGWFWWKK